MTQLTYRQRKIIDFITSKEFVQTQDILRFFNDQHSPVSRKTITRELLALVFANQIEKTGKGRSVVYTAKSFHNLLKPIDHEAYLGKEADERLSQILYFNSQTLNDLQGIFSELEITEMSMKNDVYMERRSKLSGTIIQKELERITIELAWKSSKIEGNSYTLFEAETLITEHIEAKGHTKEEGYMIINHKKALDYILSNKQIFSSLSLREIENVHRLLTEDLGVATGIRKVPVGITGTNYRPLDNQHQIKEILEKTINEINRANDPWTKSLLSLLMIAYIQPFEDGNKRTSRLVANACLIAYDICPLSLRNVDVMEYKKAITLFYELQNASLMKKIFLEQFDFAIKNYFL